MQALCINYNTLVKESEEDMNKLKNIPCLCFEWISIKMSMWSNTIYNFNASPIKIPTEHFYRNRKKPTKFVYNQKIFWVVKAIFRKNKAGCNILPGSKLYYKTIIIKTAWYWHIKNTHKAMEQNRDPRNNPCKYGQLTNDKRAKNIHWRKK